MIFVNKIVVGDLRTNCYVVSDSLTKDAIIIDAGCEYEKISEYIKSNNLNLLAILLTHGHYDHIGACHLFKQNGSKVYIHKFDSEKCEDNNLNLSNKFYDGKIQTFIPDVLIDNEEEHFNIGSINIKAIHTPGHSEGGVSYIIDKYLFSGDTIFEQGFGRTDFYDGSMQKLRESVRKLQPYLKNGYVLCDGHGYI